ncbi:MAG: hypothetical protein ACLUE7_00655 [Lachnospirales bacterium]
MKKLFSIILILVLICTSVTIVYGGDNYITVRDVVNRLDKVAGSYNPQYTKEKLLSSSSFVLDEDVTKAQCYYLISRAFDNFPQLQGIVLQILRLRLHTTICLCGQGMKSAKWFPVVL